MKRLLSLLLATLALGFGFGDEPSDPTITGPTRFVVPGQIGNPRIVLPAGDALLEAMSAFQWSGPDSEWNFPEDSHYIKPTKEDVKDFVKFFLANKAKDKYASQSNDCDENAREALYFARLWSHRQFKGKEAALMFGAAYVEIRSNKARKSYHVLNFIGYADGEWVWFEPQTTTITSLKTGLKEYRVVKLQF